MILHGKFFFKSYLMHGIGKEFLILLISPLNSARDLYNLSGFEIVNIEQAHLDPTKNPKFNKSLEFIL
jgi:hypothetical protein